MSTTTTTEAETVEAFHKLYYYDLFSEKRRRKHATWCGTPLIKNPLDLFVLQEIITETAPEVIVETGTAFGGSALYMAHVCDALGRGEILSIDKAPYAADDLPRHPRITYVRGDSVGEVALRAARAASAGKRTMVDLDSWHSQEHVLAEMEAYGLLVSPGCYMIVEDTNISHHPVHLRGYPDPGPWEAVEEFLRTHDEFEVDPEREKFLLTFNPRGYLRKSG
ncbi:MAG: CmcI family methyltransferase [Planctomycetota bacterium]|nr:CmcI family methyltransferase [Planctomycetota bacterium]